MEKISRILPPSARVRAADISPSQPVRPGAPAFGQPLGRNTLADRVSFSEQALQSQETGKSLPQPAPLVYKNNAESAKLKTIEKLSQDFFNAKIEARNGQSETASEQVLKSIDDSSALVTPMPAKLAPTESRGLPANSGETDL